MPLNELEIIDAVSFEIKDSQKQFTPAIKRKLRHVMAAILRAYDWPWAMSVVTPDLIPQGRPPRILLPVDFNELIENGVIPVLAGNAAAYSNRWGAPGRVIQDSWQVALTDWPYYVGNNLQQNWNPYNRDPLGPWYNRVSVSPDNYLHFLEPSNHAYRVNYQNIPSIDRWPSEFENIIISEISARMQIPLEGEDLITSRAEFALAKADLKSLIEQYADANQGYHREASRAEKIRYRAGYLGTGVMPILAPVVVPTITAITPTLAKPGEIAAVSGTNLNLVDSFLLNGNVTPLVNITPTTAQFTVPPLGPGNYTTTFSYAGSGGAIVVAPPVTILDVPQPAAITSLSGADWNPGTATGSVASEIKLTGRGLDTITQFRAGDIVLAVENLGTATPTIYFPVVAGTYNLVGITPNGATSPYTITVRAYPVVPLPLPTIADVLFDREGLNGRFQSDPLTEYRYYPAGMPRSFNFKFYIVPAPEVASTLLGRGPQGAAATYSQIYQHSNPRYESRHTRVEVSNTITQYFSISQNKWVLVNDFQMRGAAFVEDFSGNSATAADQFEYPDGRWTFRSGTNARGEAGTLSNRLIDFDERPPQQRVGFNFHGFDFRYDIPWADVECILSYTFMRAVGPGSEGPVPAYIANIGIDSWRTRSSDYDDFKTHGGVIGGRLKPVTNQWQCFTTFAGPPSRLTTTAPLGFAGGASVVAVPTITSSFPASNLTGATITLTGTNLNLITEYRIGTAVVALSPTTLLNVTSRTFVIPLLPPDNYVTSFTYANGQTPITGRTLTIVAAPAVAGAIPTITGFSGANWNAGAMSGSTLSELRVLGTNLNVITAFRIGNDNIQADGIGTTTPSIYLPAAAGQVNVYGEYPGGTVYVAPTDGGTTVPGPTTRDPWLWPFAQDSIWNLPIGVNAQYSPANLPIYPNFGADEEYFLKTVSTDPLITIYAPGSFTNRATGTASNFGPKINLPASFQIPDATLSPYFTPNDCTTFLAPNGRTLIQYEPFTRLAGGGPGYGYHYFEDLDIYGAGIGGSHFGSGLSAIGGSIRLGELITAPGVPIRHALKIDIWGNLLNYSASNPGFRWPATRADDGAPSQYFGTNPKLVQGALLAILPNVTEASLNLQSEAAKKIFHALQDYGAYVVDDSGYNSYYFAWEAGVGDQVGLHPTGPNRNRVNGFIASFKADLDKIIPILNIIDNNSPTTPGGGGTRRAPLAPIITP